MIQVLRSVFVAVLALPAIGIAFYGVTFTDEPSHSDRVGSVSPGSTVSKLVQEPAVAGKADKQIVKAIPVPETVDTEIARPAPADVADKGEEKDIPHVADNETEQPALTDEVVKSTPVLVERAQKKAIPKQRNAKRRHQDKTRITVPLVLVPPQKIGGREESPEANGNTSKAIRPVFEEPGKIIQNFSPSKTDDHFRRK